MESDNTEDKKDSSDMVFETRAEYEDVEELAPMEELPMDEKLEELSLEDALPIEVPVDASPETIERTKKAAKQKK